MTLQSLFHSRDSRDAADARAALRDASDNVRETLYTLDVELSREHNERIVNRITSIVRACHAALLKAQALIHKERRNSK